MAFITDPFPGWDALLAQPLLGPPPPTSSEGCQLLVRALGLDPIRVQDKAFKAAFICAAMNAAGRDHVAHTSLPRQSSPTTLDGLLFFREEIASTRLMQEVADRGEMTLSLPSGDSHTCQVFLQARSMRNNEVLLVIRGFPQGWGRKGLATHLLACAGYPQGVVRESAGALPASVALLFPQVACGVVAVAVVQPPHGDEGFRNLPRSLICPARGFNVRIQVRGVDGKVNIGHDSPAVVACHVPPKRAPPQGPHGNHVEILTMPNPFRRAQRERSRHFRAANRRLAEDASRSLPLPPLSTAMESVAPSGPDDGAQGHQEDSTNHTEVLGLGTVGPCPLPLHVSPPSSLPTPWGDLSPHGPQGRPCTGGPSVDPSSQFSSPPPTLRLSSSPSASATLRETEPGAPAFAPPQQGVNPSPQLRRSNRRRGSPRPYWLPIKQRSPAPRGPGRPP